MAGVNPNNPRDRPLADERATWTACADYLKQRLTLIGVLLGLALVKDVFGSGSLSIADAIVNLLVIVAVIALIFAAFNDMYALGWVQRVFRALDDPKKAFAGDLEDDPKLDVNTHSTLSFRQDQTLLYAQRGRNFLQVALVLMAMAITLRSGMTAVRAWEVSHGAACQKGGGTRAKGERGKLGRKDDWRTKGQTGDAGPKGDPGAKGDMGDAGTKGDAGPKGDPGAKGDMGDAGTKGDAGPKGEPGAKGEMGDAGTKGDTGPKGEPGAKGDAGAKGDLGPKGEVGQHGIRGEQRASDKRVNDVSDSKVTKLLMGH